MLTDDGNAHYHAPTPPPLALELRNSRIMPA